MLCAITQKQVRYHCKKCVYVFWVLFSLFTSFGALELLSTVESDDEKFYTISPDGLEVIQILIYYLELMRFPSRTTETVPEGHNATIWVAVSRMTTVSR
jgi:hypothetical protein